MRRLVLVSALVLVAGLASAQEAAREWPLSPVQRAALIGVQDRAAVLDARERALKQEREALQAETASVVSALRHDLGIAPEAALKFDAARSVLFEDAPVKK